MKSLAEMPVFSCNGEELGLDEIQKRNVTSVVINYLTEKKTVRAPGIKGFFGKKEYVQEPRELIVSDIAGISILFNLGDPRVSIRFSDEKMLEEVTNYDEETLKVGYVMTLMRPCQIIFHIGNLKKINWD